MLLKIIKVTYFRLSLLYLKVVTSGRHGKIIKGGGGGRLKNGMNPTLPEKETLTKCPECGNAVFRKSLKAHMRYMHIDLGSFLCSECGFTTTKKVLFESHLESHSEVRKYKCAICPYAAKQLPALKTHANLIHNPNPVMSQCSACGELFKTAWGLKQHVKGIHENVRSYPCTLCDKAFKKKTHLHYHVKTHDNPHGKKRGLNKERKVKRRAGTNQAGTAQNNSGIQTERETASADAFIHNAIG